MEFRTLVPLPADGPTISSTTHALVLGSCFAEHVGSRLAEALGSEQCCVNPFGVLYNPMSIAQALRMLVDNHEISASLPIFEGRDGLYHSWLHSTHYSGSTREECLTRCLTALTEARRVLDSADLLIVTFGTSRCYLLNQEDTSAPAGFVVANCHKELATHFTERDCTIDDIVAAWQPLLADLHRLRPTLQVVFTVSPYRYRKYGYHESQLAKARLLLAVEELTSSHSYFPAYEILLDELRDYRFYKPDMLHPSDQAVDYIWQRFREWTFTPEMDTLYQQRIKELKHTHHHANH